MKKKKRAKKSTARRKTSTRTPQVESQFRLLTESELGFALGILERRGFAKQSLRHRALRNGAGIHWSEQLEVGQLPKKRGKKPHERQVAYTIAALMLQTKKGPAILLGTSKRSPRDPHNPTTAWQVALSRTVIAPHPWIDR